MIDTIIFDIGQVLVEWDWQSYLAEFHYVEEKREKLAKAVFQNPLWRETDRGVWSDEKILESFIAVAPEYEKEIHMLWDHMEKCVRKRPYTDQWIDELKNQGLKVYYLSNYGRTLREKTRESLNFTQNCHGGIFSYEVKLIKPDPAIYKTLLEKYNLNPTQCVFIDDVLENIQGAVECGIQGIQFISYSQVRKELQEMLLK